MKPSKEHADSVFYDTAAKMIQRGEIDTGLMAKAIAKSYGDKKKAEVLYLEWSVDLMKEDAANKFKQREVERKSNKDKETQNVKKFDDFDWIVIFFVIIITLIIIFLMADI